MEQVVNRVYTPPTSLIPFFQDNQNLVQMIMGPVGSGKTTACAMRIQQLICQQRPDSNGVRKSKVAVVRSTYSKLDTTTIPTWEQWFPPNQFGSPIKKGMPREHNLHFRLKDSTTVECQVLFIALETEADKEKLKSFELTILWFHEAIEILESIFDIGSDRIKRYPSQADGGSNVWKILADYNPPDQEHWLYKLFEDGRTPAGFKLWKQPPALIKDEGGEMISASGTRYILNPRADNLRNLDPTYYAIGKKSDRFIRIYYLNEYGVAENTTPVYEHYKDSFHFAGRELRPIHGLPLLIGSDFGGTPSFVIAQFSTKGQLRILDEVLPDYAVTTGIKQMIRTRLKPFLSQFYPGFKVRGWGDPNGVRKSDADEKTCFQILNDPVDGFGARAFLPAPFQRNNIAARVDAVDSYLTSNIDGEPALSLSSRCPMLRAGFLGKYHFVRTEKPGQSGITSEEPAGGDHTHSHDALQYLCQGLQGGKKRDEVDARVAAVERYNNALPRYVSVN